MSGLLKLALALLGLLGASTASYSLSGAQDPGSLMGAVGRSLFINCFYVLAALGWSLVAFLVLDRFGGLRGIRTREQLERGNLAVAAVVSATLLGVFFMSAWTLR